MRAVRFHEYGPPTNLVEETIDRPKPGPDEVLVRVEATGVHPFDWKVRKGYFKDFMPVSLPHIPGVDLAGVVAAVGPGVEAFKPGDRVYGNGRETYAEYAISDQGALAQMPKNLTFEQAAAVPLGVATAWVALDAAGRESRRLLIHGGAGGVGAFAVQLALIRGADVIATASTANVEFLHGLGVATVIDYSQTRFEDTVSGVDAVIDTVGGEVTDRSWGVLKRGGILVAMAGPPSEEKAAEYGVRTASIQGRATTQMLTQVSELIESGRLKVELAKVFPLAEAAKAHAISESGHGRGRIVLQP
jgi:NADPH:quinone reductase-like Zn-dependent oxidoreductase